MSDKWAAFAVFSIWFSVAIAVCVGIYITKRAGCLWFMLIPAFMNVSSGEKKVDGMDKSI
jgi:uncharacterized membrane protein